MHTYNAAQTESTELLAGDVLMAIDGIEVSSNGDVALGNTTGTGTGTNNFGETNQTKLDVLFSMKRHGEVVKLKVLRKEEER